MRYITHFAQTDSAKIAHKPDTLIILLPGAYQLPEDFIAQGFVSALQARDLPIDLIMAELSFSHIADRTVLTEIHNDLIQPAMTAGYKNIWLAGISIGGYVAIAYANRYATPLAGLLLLSPYPGNRGTTGEIISAGGVSAWKPTFIAEDDTEFSNWNWLKTHADSTDIEVHLSYGTEDRFADGHQLMAQILPDSRVDRITGAHTWPVWQQLWCNFLDRRFIEKSLTQEPLLRANHA